MVSSINPALPADAPQQAIKSELRANLGFAKTEIEALQTQVFYLSLKAAPYNAVGDGVADDANAVETWIAALMATGRTGFVPLGTYRCATAWGTVIQTGPIRIIAEEGAILNGGGTGIAGDRNFIQINAGGGYEVNVRGLTWQGWGRLFRYMDTFVFPPASGSGEVPLFRLHETTSINCFQTLSTWGNNVATGRFNRVEVINCIFQGGQVAISGEGHDTNNVLIQGCLFQGLTNEAIRFGHNAREWMDNASNHVVVDNILHNIGGGTGEIHGIRLYSQFGVVANNIINNVFDEGTSDNEPVYLKSRWTSVTGNIWIAPNTGSDRAMIALGKGQPRFDPTGDGLLQTQSYAHTCTGNIFYCQPSSPQTAIFFESGDHNITGNWFENCGRDAGSVIQQGTNDVSNYPLSILVKGNTFANCCTNSGIMINALANGGQHIYDDNIIEVFLPTPPTTARHNIFVRVQGGLNADPSRGITGMTTDVFIRGNTGWGSKLFDIQIRADQEPDHYNVYVERNSFKNGTVLVSTANNGARLLHIIGNDIRNSGKLLDLNNAPMQLLMRGNRGRRQVTAATTALSLETILLRSNCVGDIRYKVVGRGSTSSADAYVGEIRQSFWGNASGTAALFGTLQTYEAFQGGATAGRIAFQATGANLNARLTPPTGNYTWDVTELDVFYDAP